jgi:hypothetical protein
MPSTSWQWDPETKTATCCYCGFTTAYAEEFSGHIEHDCAPALHPAIVSYQGPQIGRSPRPDAISRVPLNQLLACIHRGPEIRQEPCATCTTGTRIKILGCRVHGQCQLGGSIAAVRNCRDCSDRTAPRRIDPR